MKNEHTSALCPACGSDCNERDELEKAEREINRLRAAPQQAEPVWVRPDQLQKARQAPFLCRVSPTKDAPDLMPMFLHPPAAEVQKLRDAVSQLCTIVRIPNAEHIADEHNAAVAFLRRALERV